MRVFISVMVGLVLAMPGGAPVNAQAKKGAPAPSETVHYFQFEDFLGDLPAEGVLKETRQGARITSAVLDVCHDVSATSARRDRFVVTLKPDGTRLTGSGQTQEAKQRVLVDILRKPAGKAASFEGSITLGTEKLNVASSGNTDMSEKEFLEKQANDVFAARLLQKRKVSADPDDFTEVSPGAVGARVKREAFAAVVKEARKENVEIDLDSLAVDCAGLRTGEQELQVLVDPERAPALITKLKGLSGVLDAGWIAGGYSIGRAMRLAAGEWKSSSGGYDRERLASAIAESLAKNFAASVDASNWNATTGQLKVTLTRPSQLILGLGLSDRIETLMLIGPERPGSSDGLIVWVGNTAIEIVDNGPEPQLKFIDAASDDTDRIDTEAVVDRLAKDLKGKRWDAEKNAWQQE
jgi:hypothetical protein